MRFIHLADVHLDTPFAGRSESLRQKLREAAREAFHLGLQHAIDAEVDAVLVAGDLLDGANVTLATERFLLAETHRLSDAGIPLLYVTGNHDAGAPGSAARQFNWPANVHVFPDDTPRTIAISRQGRVVGTVTGIGHTTAREERDLSVQLQPPAARDLPAVALLHTQVMSAGSAEQHDRYAPSTLAALQQAGFDYWAIGHIHLRQCLATLPGIHYPGNPQGRSPRELGARGGLLVELPGPGLEPIVQFLPLGKIRWEEMVVAHWDGIHDIHALTQTLQQQWQAARDEDPGLQGGSWILRVHLQGISALAGRLANEEARSELASILKDTLGLLHAEVRTDGLVPDVALAPLRARQDAVGEILRLADALSEGEMAPGGLAQALGLTAADLAGPEARDPDGLDAYLRTLLEGADRELARRFDRGGGTP